MLKKVVSFMLVTTSGVLYFVTDYDIWLLCGLLLAAVVTRLRSATRAAGRLLTMVFVFLGLFTLMSELGIGYPESLILILTGLVVMIFYEGPEWRYLYFGPGHTSQNGRLALLIAAAMSLLFGVWLYLNRGSLDNPVPVSWPLDTLVIIGIGFALYVALMEEMIFRSFIFERLRAAAGEGMAIFGQSILYGAMLYISPVPHGLAGLVLGTIYGAVLAYLVKKSDSIYLSVFVHFVVSLVIFIELAILGRSQ